MLKPTAILAYIFILQACVPYFTTHWPEDLPEFAEARKACNDQVVETYGENDETKIEACLVEQGWSKEREWDVVFLPIGGSAGM